MKIFHCVVWGEEQKGQNRTEYSMENGIIHVQYSFLSSWVRAQRRATDANSLSGKSTTGGRGEMEMRCCKRLTGTFEVDAITVVVSWFNSACSLCVVLQMITTHEMAASLCFREESTAKNQEEQNGCTFFFSSDCSNAIL